MLEQTNIFAERIGTGDRVIAAVAKEFDTDLETVKSPVRHKHIVRCRCVIARLLRDLQFSTIKIGKTIGGRDHSTICHELKRFEELYENDPLCREVYDYYSKMMKEVRNV